MIASCPAVYLNQVAVTPEGKGSQTIDHKVHPGSLGITYELCAGITDKDAPPVHIAQEEVLEETGYSVPLDRFEQISVYR